MNKELILKEFEKEYEDLASIGLRIDGVTEIQPGQYAISVSVPFFFDHRAVPKEFLGLLVRTSTQLGDLPNEFKDLDQEKDYIWAYQRFENYVENNEGIIRDKFNAPDLSKK